MTKASRVFVIRVESDDLRKGADLFVQIYYTSRTHSQLRQLTSELLKTHFPHVTSDADDPDSAASGINDDGSDEGVALVPLGSRKQLCINDKVRALAKASGDERLNEACLDMQKAGKARCKFLPAKDEEGKMLDARDSVLVSEFRIRNAGLLTCRLRRAYKTLKTL